MLETSFGTAVQASFRNRSALYLAHAALNRQATFMRPAGCSAPRFLNHRRTL